MKIPKLFIPGCHGLKSFLNGPSLRSLAASVRAKNLLKPVVAAPLPSAAARASTSSREAISPIAAELAIAGAEVAAGTVWIAVETDCPTEC